MDRLWVVIAQREYPSARDARAVCWRMEQAEAERVAAALREQQDRVVAFAEQWLRDHPPQPHWRPVFLRAQDEQPEIPRCMMHRRVDGVCVDCGADGQRPNPEWYGPERERPLARRWREMREAFEAACEPMLDPPEWVLIGHHDSGGALHPVRSHYMVSHCSEDPGA